MGQVAPAAHTANTHTACDTTDRVERVNEVSFTTIGKLQSSIGVKGFSLGETTQKFDLENEREDRRWKFQILAEKCCLQFQFPPIF